MGFAMLVSLADLLLVAWLGLMARSAKGLIDGEWGK